MGTSAAFLFDLRRRGTILSVVSRAEARIRRSLLPHDAGGPSDLGRHLLPVAVIAGPPAFDPFAPDRRT
jgi:hypothetical protein